MIYLKGEWQMKLERMYNVVASEKIPIKIWSDLVEDGAMEQAKNLANLPFAFRHIAIMPDVHQGYGMPIGTVLAARGVVIPNAVGVDIGCGMNAVETNIPVSAMTPAWLRSIVKRIKAEIPVGFSQRIGFDGIVKESEAISYMPDLPNEYYEKALSQIGTLGGGNHFIEIQAGDNGNVWIMVHSGSRKFGHSVAERWNKVAIDMNAKWFSSVPADQDLAFLPLESEEGFGYWSDMEAAVIYARESRYLMTSVIIKILSEFDSKVEDLSWYDVAHNYARLENHFKNNVVVHRKGATSARDGEIGIIPGSMGTKSFVVSGLGNKESFMSCSHGAGRAMSRSQAKETLDLQLEIRKMGSVLFPMSACDLDEAPGAYKDIDKVMMLQAGLVRIIRTLTPLAVVKG